MTQEEAIKVLNNFPIDFRSSGGFEAMEALKIAILALRPVSREQVEKMRGEWTKKDGYTECSKCEYWYDSSENEDDGDRPAFCPSCGAPMTDEAVQMVVRRLEALHENP